MNFVGHAEAARWSREEPSFLFGAMLPDFLHMAGARMLEVREPSVAAGVAHHHRVDAAFHGAPIFVALCAEGVSSLVAAGVRKGTARAVAHVGTELFLDGHLVRRPEVEAAYIGAIKWAGPDAMASAVTLADDDGARLGVLGSRLRAWGAPHDYRRPTFVADRLTTILAARPRLAIVDDERDALLPFLERRRVEVELVADALLSQVRERLAAARD
jgi:acyl carrier protein phosphodiesterase